MNVKSFLQNPMKYVFVSLSNRHILESMSDKTYLKIYYRLSLGKKLNLKNPKSFNEKLQWLKLYDRKQFYSNMVDKYEAKIYVAERIGNEYIIPTIGVWDSFEEINFDELPNQFVIKCTHDSGGLIICRDKEKLDRKDACERINRSLANQFFYSGREWPYKNVKPRIIAEKYMQDGDTENLTVYKIFNFGGEPKILQAIQDDKTDHETIDYFDVKWNRLNLKQNFPNSKMPLKCPEQFGEMLELARKLSQGFPFLRTDFYVINGRVYFSEFTFYSDCGFKAFDPPKWDYKLGEWIDLSMINSCEMR